jgi:hypothetical protein
LCPSKYSSGLCAIANDAAIPVAPVVIITSPSIPVNENVVKSAQMTWIEQDDELTYQLIQDRQRFRPCHRCHRLQPRSTLSLRHLRQIGMRRMSGKPSLYCITSFRLPFASTESPATTMISAPAAPAQNQNGVRVMFIQ